MFIFFTFPFAKHVIVQTNVFYTWFQTWLIHDKNLFMFNIFYHSLNFCKYNSSTNGAFVGYICLQLSLPIVHKLNESLLIFG